MKKAIFFSANYWGNKSMFVGSHQIAKKLIDFGWEIAFIGNPISPYHFLGRNSEELEERLEIYRAGGYRDCDDRLWSYVPASLLIPKDCCFFRSDIVYKNFHKFTYPNMVDAIRKNGFENVELVYFDNIMYANLLEELSYKKAIFRIADKNSGFGKWTNEILYDRERELAKSVDGVLYTAESLKEYVDSLQAEKTYLFENGVDIERFDQAVSGQGTISKNEKPIIIYCGAVAEWFDVDMLCYAAEKRPEYQFDIIGNAGAIKDRVKKYKNIRLYGKRAYDEVVEHIIHADVGIIPFKVEQYRDLIDYVNPLKLYEYMAGYLPVVSASWKAIDELDSPAMLYKSREEFIRYLDIAVSEGKKEIYHEYVKKYSWGRKVKFLLAEFGLNK